MTKMLIVEDDIHKRDQLLGFFHDRFPAIEVKVAVSLIGGIRVMREITPEIVILDMTLPNYDPEGEETSNSMQAFGGEEFLRQAQRGKADSDVIVVTQFETFGDGENLKDRNELEADLSRDFPSLFRGMVYYHASLSGWVEELEHLVNQTLIRRGEHDSRHC